ncbi:radical SAM protein [Bacteriovoracaceae bacterium]|nr:radical SAM protein [Bacteriovoracaceae bacterium]
MRIFFLNPPLKPHRNLMRNFDCATESKGSYLYQPYDFLLLSAKIGKEDEFEFLDCIADNLCSSRMIERVQEFNASHIVISVAQSSYNNDLIILKKIKNEFPNLIIIIFGDILFSKAGLGELEDIIDFGITDPLTFSFNEIRSYKKEDLKRIEFQGKWEIFFLKIKDLKAAKQVSIGTPLHAYFLNKKYRWPFSYYKKYTTIFTSWGCPYSCSYCILRNFPNLYRPWEEVLEEIRYVVKDLKIKEIYIGDRSFGLPRSNVIRLLEGIIDKGFKFKWSTYFHVNQYDKELLDLMYKSGCRTIIIGVETATFVNLKAFGRNFKEDRFNMLISHCKKIGMAICGDFIIGLPGQNKDEIIKTIELSKESCFDYASFNIAAPLPGSIIQKEGTKLREWDQYDSLGKFNVIGNEFLSGKEIVELRDRAVREFYLRPRYLLKRLLRIRTIDQFFIQIFQGVEILRKLFTKKV